MDPLAVFDDDENESFPEMSKEAMQKYVRDCKDLCEQIKEKIDHLQSTERYLKGALIAINESFEKAAGLEESGK